MGWQQVGNESVTRPDEKAWEIDLHMDKGFPLLRWRKAQFKVKASAYREGHYQFAILGSASTESVEDAKTAAMKEACRRIVEGDWELSREYAVA